MDDGCHLPARFHRRIGIPGIDRSRHGPGLRNERLAGSTAIRGQCRGGAGPVGSQFAAGVTNALGKEFIDQCLVRFGAQRRTLAFRVADGDDLVAVADLGVWHGHLAGTGAVLRLGGHRDHAVDRRCLRIELRGCFLQLSAILVACRACGYAACRFARTFPHVLEEVEMQVSRRVVEFGELACGVEVALVECRLHGLGQCLGCRCCITAGGHGQSGQQCCCQDEEFHVRSVSLACDRGARSGRLHG